MENTALFTVLRDKYQIGDAYIAAYLRKTFGTLSLSSEEFHRKLADNTILANWLDYALSTNLRGRAFAREIHPYIGKNARRYLDVGSAYGGFLIGFMELGLDVVGIEYDQGLVDLCNANLQDFNLAGVQKVITGSILDESSLGQIGKFDVITCIDVIEHVSDVQLAMKNMVQLLNPGGIIVLQLPNKDSLLNIISDSHYGVFGITLLKHDDAKKLHFCYFPNSKMDDYDVGEYYQRSYYLNSLASLGCEASALSPLSPSRISDKIRLAPRFFAHLSCFLFKPARVPLNLKLKVIFRAVFYILSFFLQFLVVMLFAGRERDAFKGKFVDDAWLILGTKTGL